MTTTLEFTGAVKVPAGDGCNAACGDGVDTFTLTLTALVGEFEAIHSGVTDLVFSASFQQLLPDKQDTLEFLALSIDEGNTTDLELLLGRPPTLLGVGGTFPLPGSGTLLFQLVRQDSLAGTVRMAVSVALTAGDTLTQVVAKINAAAILVGATAFLASAEGDQVRIKGDVPGALETLVVVTPKADAGFATAGTVLGVGSPMTVTRLFASSFVSTLFTDQDVWVRGGPLTLRYVAAGR